MIPFHEINDLGYCIFILSNGISIKILVGKWENYCLALVDDTEITVQEFENIRNQLIDFYNDDKF